MRTWLLMLLLSLAAWGQQDAQTCLGQARDLARRGLTDSAILAYRQAIELDPKLVQAYAEYGQLLVEAKNLASARTVYTRLAELEPDNARWKEALVGLDPPKPQQQPGFSQQLRAPYPQPRDWKGGPDLSLQGPQSAQSANVFSLGGSDDIRVCGAYQDDHQTGALSLRQDMASYTPGWVGVSGNMSYQITDRLGLSGDVTLNRYTHGTGDRFGPTNFQVNSVGTSLYQWVSPDLRCHAGYYYSTTNLQGSGGTFLAGLDAQLNQDSYLWLNYERGSFYSGYPHNYTIEAGLRLSF